MASKREQAIQRALDLGMSKDDINYGLASVGDKPLTGYEEKLINSGRYGMNFGQRVGKDVQELASGISSFGGAVGNYIYKPIFRDYVNQKIGDYAGQVARGERNVIVDTGNAILSPYQTTVEDIVTNPVAGVKSLAEGAAVSPFNATIDLVTLTPKGAVTKVASKVDDVPIVGGIRKAILPTEREKDIAKIINLQDPTTLPAKTTFTKKMNELANKKDFNVAIKDLTYGTKNASPETRTSLSNFLNDMSKEMNSVGVPASDAPRVAKSQYVYETLNSNRDVPGLYYQHAQDAVDAYGKEVADNTARMEKAFELGKGFTYKESSKANKAIDKLGLSRQDFKALYDTADDLSKSGDILPISQRGLMGKYKSELVDQSKAGSGIGVERVFGYGTPEEVAKNFPRAYDQLYDEIQSARNAGNSFEEIATKYGRPVTVDEAAKIGKNEVIVSPTEMKEGIKTLFATGKQSELGNLIKRKGLETTQGTLKKYANDLYVVNKSDIKALANAAGGYNPSGIGGKLISFAKPIIGLWKGSVLATPQYFAGNRIGNLALGAIGGADYLTALTPGMIKKYIPDYLKEATSYHGLNPGLYDDTLTNTYKNITRDVKGGIEDLLNPNYNAQTRLSGLGQAIKGTQDYITKPLFGAESTAELIDRSAVYFNEAKKMAKATGQSTEDILNKALTDKDLQRELITGVNNVLGDYINRNPYINPNLYELVGTGFPFHKILTTSTKVATEQLRKHPFRVQAFYRQPARAGYALEQREGEYGQPVDTDPRGGLIYNPSLSRAFPAEKIYNDYHPFNAPLEIIQRVAGVPTRQGESTGVAGAMDIIGGNLSPLTGFANALQGKDRWGNDVVGPNTYRVGNKIVTLDNNGNRLEEQPVNPIATTASFVGQNFMPGVVFYNNFIGPAIGRQTGEGFYRPTNRAMFGSIGQDQYIPGLIEGNTKKAPIKTGEDMGLKLMGFKKRDVYYPRPDVVTPNQMKQALKQRAKNRILLEQRGF